MKYESASYYIRVVSDDTQVLAKLNHHFQELGITFTRDQAAEYLQQLAVPEFTGIIAQAIFSTTSSSLSEGLLSDLHQLFPEIDHLESGPHI